MGKLIPIPKGALMTVTTGCYSDYSVSGVFRALAKIDVEALRSEWLKDHPEQSQDYSFDDSAFLADMTKRGLLECVECWELHLGDYSRASEIWVSKFAVAA